MATREDLERESALLLLVATCRSLRLSVKKLRGTLDLQLGPSDSMWRARSASAFKAHITTQLVALDRLLAHSWCLSAFPELKHAFWRALVASGPHVGTGGAGVCTKLVEFLTRRHLGLPSDAIQLKLVLRQGRKRITLEMLRLLESALDRAFASPERQFAVRSLDLWLSEIRPTQLPAVEQILAKCHSVYRIGDAQLPYNNTFSKDALVASSDTSVGRSHPGREVLSSLRSVWVGLDRFRLADVAAMCASLRYGSRLERLHFSCRRSRMLVDELDLVMRWVAFAVFYPHAKRLTADDRLASVKIWFSLLQAGWTEAIAHVMVDPVAALLGRKAKEPDEDTTETTKGERRRCELLVCRAKQGARFYVAASDASEELLTLDRECELELLVQNEKETGWACVVVLGVGLGWTKSDEVEEVEREVVDSMTSTNGRGVKVTFDLVISEHYQAKTHAFLERFGNRVTSICGFFHTKATEVKSILQHCPNLTVINCQNKSLEANFLDAIIEAIGEGHGARLEQLRLSKTPISHDTLDRLATCLSDRKNLPALRELDVVIDDMRADTLASFHCMLQANQKLRFIRLPGPFGDAGDDESNERDGRHRADDSDEDAGDSDHEQDPPGAQLRDDERDRAMSERLQINDAFQGKLLPTKLPLRAKLAFLSVLRPSLSSAESSRLDLDSFMASTIFRFASDSFKRRILWEE